MQPDRAVTTHIDISARDDFRLFSGSKIKSVPVRTLIVSSHKLGICAACLCLSITALPASSIALLTTPGRIIIAADSALTTVTKGKSDSKGRTICKIRRKGRFFYGAVGDYGIPGVKTDVWSIARTAASDAATIHEVGDLAVKAIFAIVPEIISRNRLADPKTYSKWRAGVPVISLFFASFEEGRPAIVCIDFRIDKNGVPVRATPAVTGAIRGRLNTGRFGYTAEMAAAIQSVSWQRDFVSNPIDASRDLIQREIDASIRDRRYDVGPPITIAVITAAAGDYAKGYKGVCPGE